MVNLALPGGGVHLALREQQIPQLGDLDTPNSHQFVTSRGTGDQFDLALRDIGQPGEESHQLLIGLPLMGWRGQGDDQGSLLDADDGGAARSGLGADAQSDRSVAQNEFELFGHRSPA